MYIGLKFGYDGRQYNGYARQPHKKTVEGEIIKSLIKNEIIEDTTRSKFRSASRTDKGVSALGNAIAFDTNKSYKDLLKILNEDFQDIVFFGYSETLEDFYPRYASQRIYRYYLQNNNLNIEKIKECAKIFTGEHNFKNFAKFEDFRNPVRSIEDVIVDIQNKFITIDFIARTFLWNQIRRIISAIIKFENGQIKRHLILDALNYPNKRIDYGLAKPEYLILKDIKYNFDFSINKRYLLLLNKLEKNIISSF
jgi:tRNA pseudouridine38-40 synthase